MCTVSSIDGKKCITHWRTPDFPSCDRKVWELKPTVRLPLAGWRFRKLQSDVQHALQPGRNLQSDSYLLLRACSTLALPSEGHNVPSTEPEPSLAACTTESGYLLLVARKGVQHPQRADCAALTD